MRLFLLFILTTAIWSNQAAAQNYSFSQYANTGSWMNPSQPSLVQETAVRLNYRLQSIGNYQSIKSAVINAYYPWLARRGNGPTSTIGLMVLDDKIAPANGLSFQTVGLSLSYAFSIGKYQRLSFGLMPSYGLHRMDNQGFKTISQYTHERGYVPSMPMNEPLLNARGSFWSWNTGVSWRKFDKRDRQLSSAGFSFYNINGPSETFLIYQSSIPLAMQAYMSTTVYENHSYRLVPELFFSSYGSSYQLQLGGNFHYSLRQTNLREGELILGSRYNLSKSVIFLLQFDQPAYVFGLSTDLYTSRESPFSHAFEVSMALRQAVVGNSARKWKWNWPRKWKWGKKRKSKRNSTRRKELAKRKTGYEKKDKYVKVRPKLPEVNRQPYLQPIVPPLLYIPEGNVKEKMKHRRGEINLAALSRNIHFKTSSVQLTDEGLDALKDVAELLLKNPDFNLRIVGHTDDIGGAAFNKVLSLQRAETVKEVLLGYGVAASQVETEGAGMEYPLVPNSSTINRQLNRRVEFMLFEK